MLASHTEVLPTLVGLSSAFPEQVYEQTDLWDQIYTDLYAEVPDARRLGDSTRVRRRHLAMDPFEVIAADPIGIGQRMRAFTEVVQPIACRACAPLIEDVGADNVGSFVMATSSGYHGPTPDLFIAKAFGLKANLRRTFIGHMGCFAAFNVMKTAIDAVVARQDEHVIGVCAEFSSLHFVPQTKTAQDIITTNLFGDAVGAFALAMKQPGYGPQILATHTHQAYEASDLMSLSLDDDAIRMSALSRDVPYAIADVIGKFVDDLCTAGRVAKRDVTHWIIHPGGPKIIEMVAKNLRIEPEKLGSTWHVLNEYGNCASASVLLVLEHLIANERPAPADLGIMLGFGPGLTVEGALLRF